MTVDKAIDEFAERINKEELEETRLIAIEMFGNMINFVGEHFDGKARNDMLSELLEGGMLSSSEIADIAF